MFHALLERGTLRRYEEERLFQERGKAFLQNSMGKGTSSKRTQGLLKRHSPFAGVVRQQHSTEKNLRTLIGEKGENGEKNYKKKILGINAEWNNA